MDDDVREFWEEQSQLPHRERDGMWWAAIGLPNIGLVLLAIVFVGLLAKDLLG